MRGKFSASCLVMLVLAASTGIRDAAAQVAVTPESAHNLSHLQSLLDYARVQNPEVMAMRLEAGAVQERVLPAGSLADPQLRLELQDISRLGEQNPSVFPGRVGSTKYTLMQALPWSGKRDLKRQIASAEAGAALGGVELAWQNLAAQIKVAYVQWFSVTRNEVVAREILDLMERLEKIAQLRYAHGLAMQQDVIRAQLEQTAMRNELIMLTNDAAMLHLKLNTLLGRSVDAALPAPTALPALPAAAKLDRGALWQRVSARNPQLLLEDARLQGAEKSRDLTLKNRYPDFTVGVSPIQSRRSIREWELMFEVNLPLQQASRRSMERESDAMLSAARTRKRAIAQIVLGELAENLLGLESARQIELQLSQRLLPQAEASFASALGSYENGKLDFATLLEAQQQIRQARQSQIKAQIDAQLRLVAIEKLLGEDL